MYLSKSRKRVGAVALSLGLFASACGGAATDESTSSAPVDDGAEVAEESSGGAGLPQLVGDTVAGTQFDTADLAGQDIAVWFWAPW